MRGPRGTRRLLRNLPPRVMSMSRPESMSPRRSPACLPGAQSQPVAQGKDGAVGQAALRGPRAVGQRGCGVEQLAGLADVEQERDRRGGHLAPAHPKGGGIQQLAGDGPVEQPGDDTTEVVEAAGPGSWP
jgi:hypothetical protein